MISIFETSEVLSEHRVRVHLRYSIAHDVASTEKQSGGYVWAYVYVYVCMYVCVCVYVGVGVGVWV